MRSVFLKHLQTEPVGHAGDVITDRALQALLFDKLLEVAGHKLRLSAQIFKKNLLLKNGI